MLAFSLLSGPPTVHLLGNASVSFGAPTCDPNTQYYDSQYTGTCRAFSDVGPPAGSGGGGDTGHWYDSLVTAFTKGAAQGLLPGQTAPTPPAYHPPITQPWYTQWWGIGIIAVGALGAGSLLLGGSKK
jgi:hypothetical protein